MKFSAVLVLAVTITLATALAPGEPLPEGIRCRDVKDPDQCDKYEPCAFDDLGK